MNTQSSTDPAPEAAPLPARLAAYQSERFPLGAYLPLVAVATFAALAFSRAARGAVGIPAREFVVGTFTALALFFLLRVLDEHKDADGDAAHRPELPVPRGLVSLRELRWTAGWTLGLAIVLNLAVDPRLLGPLGLAIAWAALMGREFFLRDWLRPRPLAYLLSHMVVMPLILLYATTLDWLVAGALTPPAGLAVFLAFAFANGLIIEIGRKLRAPAEERTGVDTYTAAWGPATAAAAWIAALAAAVITAALAARAFDRVHAAPPMAPLGPAADGTPIPIAVVTAMVLAPIAVAAALPVIRLVRAPAEGIGRRIEVASGIWVLASYLTFGIIAFWLAGTTP